MKTVFDDPERLHEAFDLANKIYESVHKIMEVHGLDREEQLVSCLVLKRMLSEDVTDNVHNFKEVEETVNDIFNQCVRKVDEDGNDVAPQKKGGRDDLN